MSSPSAGGVGHRPAPLRLACKRQRVNPVDGPRRCDVQGEKEGLPRQAPIGGFDGGGKGEPPRWAAGDTEGIHPRDVLQNALSAEQGLDPASRITPIADEGMAPLAHVEQSDQRVGPQVFEARGHQERGIDAGSLAPPLRQVEKHLVRKADLLARRLPGRRLCEIAQIPGASQVLVYGLEQTLRLPFGADLRAEGNLADQGMIGQNESSVGESVSWIMRGFAGERGTCRRTPRASSTVSTTVSAATPPRSAAGPRA